MNILRIFKVNSYTYFFFFICFITGYVKEALLIFLIIIIHESGHIIMSFIVGYKVKRTELYPFGGITYTDKYLNSPISKDILVYISGVTAQLLVIITFKLLRINISELFYHYNTAIIIFNLMPIYPLDGFHILSLFIEKHFSYYISLYIMQIISLIMIILFTIISYYHKLSSILIICFLIYQNFRYYKEKNKVFNRFLLERYLYDFPYYKICYLYKKDLRYLKRESMCFFHINQKVYSEKELLAKKFDINGSF